MALRHAVHRRGLRYRVDVLLARACRPDLLFPRHRLAVFVDGCFWHGCPRHGRSEFAGPNRELWVAKLTRNARNDRRANDTAAELGYAVLRLWECEIREAVDAAADRVEAAVGSAAG